MCSSLNGVAMFQDLARNLPLCFVDLGEYTAEEQKGMLCDQAHGEKGKDQVSATESSLDDAVCAI